MSQEKVNRYKQEKANRKQNMAREKRKRTITYVIIIVIVVLIAAWIIYSAVNSITRNQAAKQTPVNLDAVSNYMMELSTSGEDGSDEGTQEPAENEEETSGTEDNSEEEESGDDAEAPEEGDDAEAPEENGGN